MKCILLKVVRDFSSSFIRFCELLLQECVQYEEYAHCIQLAQFLMFKVFGEVNKITFFFVTKKSNDILIIYGTAVLHCIFQTVWNFSPRRKKTSLFFILNKIQKEKHTLKHLYHARRFFFFFASPCFVLFSRIFYSFFLVDVVVVEHYFDIML